ncbi:MAG: glycosyltransferase, partial [Acidobacteriota bacterium]
MKLLYVSDVYFPRVNGVSTSIRTFMHELRELGHEVHLLAPAYGEGDREEAGVTRIKAFSVPFDPEDRFMLAGKIRARVDELAAENYDLVHIQTPFVAHRVGKQLARRLDVPVLETYHTYFEEYLNHYVPFSPPGLMRSLARRMTRRQCNDVDAVVVPSHAMREVLEGYGVRSPIEVVPTGLSPADFQSGDGEAFRRRFRIHRQRPTLVHIGRVAFEKNIDFLMRVLRR